MDIEQAKHVADGTFATVIIGIFFDVLPKVSAILCCLWFALRVFESDSVQALLGDPIAQWRKNRQAKRRAHK